MSAFGCEDEERKMLVAVRKLLMARIGRIDTADLQINKKINEVLHGVVVSYATQEAVNAKRCGRCDRIYGKDYSNAAGFSGREAAICREWGKKGGYGFASLCVWCEDTLGPGK